MTKILEEYTKDELIDYIKHLKKQKKFGLVWEDKPEQVAKDCEQNLPVLEEDSGFAITKKDDDPTNIIIEGDSNEKVVKL